MRIRRDAAIAYVLVVDGCVFVVITRLIVFLGCVLFAFVGFRNSDFGVYFVVIGGVPIGHFLNIYFGLPQPGLAHAGVDPTSASTTVPPVNTLPNRAPG